MEKLEEIFDKIIKKMSFITDKLQIVSDKIYQATGKKIDVAYILIGIIVLIIFVILGINIAAGAFSSVASGEIYNQ